MHRWVLGLVLLALPVWAEERTQPLKDGPGKEVVTAHCMTCHSLDYIPMNAPFLDRKGWEAIVTKMIKVMGAPVPPADVPALLDYLSTYYGKP